MKLQIEDPTPNGCRSQAFGKTLLEGHRPTHAACQWMLVHNMDGIAELNQNVMDPVLLGGCSGHQYVPRSAICDRYRSNVNTFMLQRSRKPTSERTTLWIEI